MALLEPLQFPLLCHNTLLPTFIEYSGKANPRAQYVDAIAFPEQSERQRCTELPIQRSDGYIEDSMFEIDFDAALDIASYRGHMNNQSATVVCPTGPARNSAPTLDE